MTLVKLDSGDYINTEAVDSIKGGDDQYLVMRCGDVISITPADRDLIVAEMKSEQKLHNLKMMALQRGLIV
ncbi:hypothetical protein [Lacticaseibacillus songhuajiangensis]|jgi:hypothetical protein|uniref:hypothetical protein n=1 Tax=Lacticaseibacillus songhuajiangensis TaxID=1296539 RepID=UPI000F7681BC|nr:hypothetical protein [Lacticaseibacillus songhuajiangensis]